MEIEEATAYLKQFIGKTLRISTTDGRMFAGTMRCTDKVRYLRQK
jgi:N-alpha-acetyltransferase 38, NatC auxiliary subunit